MISRREAMGVVAASTGASAAAGAAGNIAGMVRRVTLQSSHVPGPVPVTIYQPAPPRGAAPLPLLLLLHGGNGSDQDLLRFLPAIDAAIRDGRVPPLVVATPSAGRSLYMDYRDGSQRWESFLLRDLLPYLRRDTPVSTEPRRTFIGGLSMGGLGSLRIAFKHPDLFGGVAALEPAIEPALSWQQVGPYVKFWRPEAVIAPMFGSPIDADFWAANNPATIAWRDPRRLIDLPIYFEVGDQDMLYLTEGAEFLHRILFDAGVAHEYRQVHGGDHVGPSLAPRMVDAIGFLARLVDPPGWIDAGVLRARAGFDAMKSAAGLPVESVDPRRIHRPPGALRTASDRG